MKTTTPPTPVPTAPAPAGAPRLREAAAAEYIGAAKDTLRVWRSKSRRAGHLIGPRWIEIRGGAGRARIIWYALADLDAWLAASVVALEPPKKRGRPRKTGGAP